MEREKDEEITKGLNLILKSSIIVLAGFILSKIFGYVYRIIIARHFGPEIYGLFSLATLIVGWVVAVAGLGFTEGILRYASLYRGKNELNKIRYVFRFSSKILLLSTILFSTILFLLSNQISLVIVHDLSLSVYLRILSWMVVFWVFSSYFLAIMRSFERIKEISLIESITQSFVKVLLLIVFVWFGLEHNAIIFSFFASIVVMFLLSFFYCKLKISEVFEDYRLDEKTKKKVFSNFVSYSWPVLFFGVISSLFYWVDSLAIGYFKSATEVGLYNAVVPIVVLLNIVPEIFLQMFFPMITKKYSLKNMNFIKETSKQIGKWILLFNLPLIAIMLIFPDVIIGILFGQDYVIASNSMRFLSLGVLFSSISLISNNLLSMSGKSKILFYDILIVTIINLILNVLLVPQKSIFGLDNSLGINGAAIATAMSMILFSVTVFVQAKKYTSITPIKKEMLSIIFAAIISATFAILIKGLLFHSLTMFFVVSFLFASSYLSLLFFFNVFEKNDSLIVDSVKLFNKKMVY